MIPLVGNNFNHLIVHLLHLCIYCIYALLHLCNHKLYLFALLYFLSILTVIFLLSICVRTSKVVIMTLDRIFFELRHYCGANLNNVSDIVDFVLILYNISSCLTKFSVKSWKIKLNLHKMH